MFSFLLFNNRGTRFLNLELSALQADGRGKIISSPRVITADQVEATIEQGTEIPYQQATSSGATAVQFKKATLSLKVKPQITPDDNVIMSLNVHKDSVGQQTLSGPSIDTKQVTTEVLVENGGTVVIGGIYTQDERTTINKVPVLGRPALYRFLFQDHDQVRQPQRAPDLRDAEDSEGDAACGPMTREPRLDPHGSAGRPAGRQQKWCASRERQEKR